MASNDIPGASNRQNSHEPRFDVSVVRKDFPILGKLINGNPLVYLDSAATSQKPNSVIDSLVRYYNAENANVHRGIHSLSQEATEVFEGAREKIRSFINASNSKEIIFVRGTTEGINLISQTFGRQNISEDDEIIVSAMEHHSNIVPWQILCKERGAKLRVIPITDSGEIVFEEFQKLLNPRTKLVSIVHLSNTLGTINPVESIIQASHQAGVPVLLDGAQSVPHVPIDVQKLDCDFLVFSGHKLYGPTGIGVVYGKEGLLESMPPFQGGGDMIRSVTFEETLFNELPYKFEAGTPNIAGAVGLGAAIDYVNGIGINNIFEYEHDLLEYASERLVSIPGLQLIGTAKNKADILSFILEGIHPHDIGTILDEHGVAIRTGHHCTMPLMQRLGIPATARASLAFYNTKEEIDILCDVINKVKEVFR